MSTIRTGRSERTLNPDYKPTFFENLKIDSSVNQTCNGEKACILDTLVSGVPEFGADTQKNQQAAKTAVEINS